MSVTMPTYIKLKFYFYFFLFFNINTIESPLMCHSRIHCYYCTANFMFLEVLTLAKVAQFVTRIECSEARIAKHWRQLIIWNTGEVTSFQTPHVISTHMQVYCQACISGLLYSKPSSGRKLQLMIATLSMLHQHILLFLFGWRMWRL